MQESSDASDTEKAALRGKGRGTKCVCASCGAKFYDLNRAKVVCPLCDKPYVRPAIENTATEFEGTPLCPESSSLAPQTLPLSLPEDSERNTEDDSELPDFDNDSDIDADISVDEDIFLEEEGSGSGGVDDIIGDVKSDDEDT